MTTAQELIEDVIESECDFEIDLEDAKNALGLSEAKELSKVKKKIADHMWVISKDSAGGYIVTMGDPKKSSSKIKHRFSDKSEMKAWAKKTLDGKVSQDRMMDISGLKLVPDVHSQFYLDMQK